MVTPHLQTHNVGGHQVLVVSETFNTLLHGGLYCDIVALLDGSNTVDQIVQALQSKHGFPNILSALASLSAKGYVVSADHSLDRGRAAYWSALGASPSWAEQRLEESCVAVDGDKGALAGHLTRAGVEIGKTSPSLTVYVRPDYLSADLAEANRRHMGSGAPWMVVRPQGIEPLFGPVFASNATGPCWNCLGYRLSSHQEVHNFLRFVGGEEQAFIPFAMEPAMFDSVQGLVASEIAKWLVLDESSTIHKHALTLETRTLSVSKHRVMRRPQCEACGDESLRRPDRSPISLKLQSSQKSLTNSGGTRSVAPEVTLAKYRHLVSPVSGVVSWLARTTDETDTWLHVYWAGSNFGLRNRSLSTLRRSLRSKSAGKGSTREQSEASALCEAIERYSGAAHGDEIRRCSSFVEFADEEGAIHPNDVQLFSDSQLDNAAEINTRGHPYNVVPPRFDEEARVDWTPVWSLTQQRHRYLPTSVLYGMSAEQRGSFDLYADSNGCASGNTMEEAILQGFLELVERDAFAIWWYNRLQVPSLDLESFGDEYLSSANAYYADLGRELWLLDVTSDFAIPAFVAVSRKVNAQTEDIIYGAGAHLEPRIAALRALCELNQCLTWLPRSSTYDGKPQIDDPVALEWWKTSRIDSCPWLAPSDMPARKASDYGFDATQDLREDVESCRAVVEAKGMDFLVLDQTRPDIGMPVARVIVPGMRHFWARFAPGRLYDVPPKMGWRRHPLTETELNSSPVIA